MPSTLELKMYLIEASEGLLVLTSDDDVYDGSNENLHRTGTYNYLGKKSYEAERSRAIVKTSSPNSYSIIKHPHLPPPRTFT